MSRALVVAGPGSSFWSTMTKLPVKHPLARQGSRLYDVLTNACCWIWFELNPDDDMSPEPSLGHSQRIGEMPDWCHYELSESGIEELLILEEADFDSDYPICVEWAWRNGLAPRQPFCVCLYYPRYYQSYDGDHDVAYDLFVVDREPRGSKSILKAWQRTYWLKDIPVIEVK